LSCALFSRQETRFNHYIINNLKTKNYEKFATAESIVAGKPYLVKVADGVENPTFDGVIVTDGTTIPTETAKADFVPVMKPTFLTGCDKTVLFVTGGDKLTYPTADGNINGFRAYFQLKGDAVDEARAFRMNIDGEATSIREKGIVKSEKFATAPVYDLQSRHINGSAQKGVYVVNGKKVIIK